MSIGKNNLRAIVVALGVASGLTGMSLITSHTSANAAAMSTRNARPSAPTGAATFSSFLVTNTNDAGPGSLRDAILSANAAAGADTITFDTAGVFAAPQVITLTSGELLITDSLTITGTSANQLSISGNHVSRVFKIASGNFDVTLSALTIANGRALGIHAVHASPTFGGGVYNECAGILNITASALSGNSVVGGLGDVEGGDAYGGGVYNSSPGGTVNITNSILSGNSATGGDGFEAAGRATGGAVFNQQGTVNITSSTLTGNSAIGGGGAPSSSGRGGGVGNFGTMKITRSTLSGNSAPESDFGGGAVFDNGMLDITNCTISGNSSRLGGGLTLANGIVNLTSSTIVGNSAGFIGGGILICCGATVNVSNTIVANNTSPTGPDLYGELTSQGYNLIKTVTADATIAPVQPTDIFGLDPLLGSLQNNGGPTPTMLPLAGSPAIDRGNSALTTDQRGLTRPVDFPSIFNAIGGNAADIGAVEVGCAPSITTVSLPPGIVETNYSQTINVSPAGSYAFSVVQGNLPAGMTLNSSMGVISGAAVSPGVSNFMVKVQAPNGCSVTQAYSLYVNCPTVNLGPESLPNGQIGTSYAQMISVSPAAWSYTFFFSGSLPPGLTLNPWTGLLSGTPTSNGTFNFSVTATSNKGCSGSRNYSVIVAPGSCPSITLSALPNGMVGKLYVEFVSASPAESYSSSLTGTLPPGLVFYSAIGLVYGYPTAVGSYSFSITATNLNNCTGARSYTVMIGP